MEFSDLKEAMDNYVNFVSQKGAQAYESMNQLKSILAKHLNRTNYKYLRTVFFPEFTEGARYPGKFPAATNVFTLKQSLTFKPSPTGDFGLMINPANTNNWEPGMFYFGTASANTWDKGTPYTFDGRNISAAEFKTSTLTPSPDRFFSKCRLVGCSVIVASLGESRGMWRMGVEYDVPLKEGFTLPESNIIEDHLTMASASDFFLSSIYEVSSGIAGALEMAEADLTAAKSTDTGVFNTAYTDKRNFANVYARRLQGAVAEEVPTTASWRRLWMQQTDMPTLIKRIENERKGDRPSVSNVLRTILKVISAYSINYPTIQPDRAGTNERNPAASGEENATQDQITVTATYLRDILKGLATKWSTEQSQLIARQLKGSYGELHSTFTASEYPSGPLSYNRISEAHYSHDSRVGEGGRIVYIPSKELDWNKHQDTDVILVGGQGLSDRSLIQIQIVRHFEGIPIPGIKEMFPGEKEIPDQRAIELVGSVFSVYPQLVRISPTRLETYYLAMKKSFKWFDLVLKERGDFMEVERPLSLPNTTIVKSTADEQPGKVLPLGPSIPSIEDID